MVLTFDELTAELFYPECVENQSMTPVATTLVSESATMITMELAETRKANSKTLSYIQGKYSMSEATEQINQDGIGKKTNDSVLENRLTEFK